MYFHRPIQLPASLMPQSEPVAKPALSTPIDIAPTKAVVSRPKLRNGALKLHFFSKKDDFLKKLKKTATKRKVAKSSFRTNKTARKKTTLF